MIGLLILAAVGSVTPQDRAFAKQAERCGIRRDQIVWSTDTQGHRRPSLTPHGDLDSLPYSAFKCIFEWGRRTHTKMGFISAPPAPEEQVP